MNGNRYWIERWGADRMLTPEQFQIVLGIVVRNEPFAQSLARTNLARVVMQSEGWLVYTGNQDGGQDSDDDGGGGEVGEVVGFLMFDCYRPLHSVRIHAVVDAPHQRQFLNRNILRRIAHWVFVELGCVKLYGYAVPWRTFQAANSMEALGFKPYAYDTKGGVDPSTGELFDVVDYELLKEDCKWLRK